MNYSAFVKKKGYEIKTEKNSEPICKINFENIYSSTASFEYNDNKYSIKANNIWQTKFDIFKSNSDIGDIDYNWKGEIIIRLKNKDEITKHFILKNKSIFNFKFELRDFLTNHLWTITPIWSWKGFKYNFAIISEPGFSEEENRVEEIELLVAAIYAVNLYMQNAAAASS